MKQSIDPNLINELRELMEDDFDLLLSTYLEDAASQYAAAGDACRQQDWATLRRSAHSLKGASANVGAVPLSDLCAKLEKIAMAEGGGDAGPVLVEVGAELGRVSEELEALR